MPTAEAEIFHFTTCPEDDVFARLNARLAGPLTPRLQAQVDGVAYVATHTDLLPIGMCIGPFSLMSKLVVDPITPVAMAGAGVTAEDDDEVRLVERVLELGMKVILRSLSAQVQAGAQAIFIAEPAANLFYFSPNQLEDGADTFNQYVVQYHRIIKGMLDEWGVDLIFHCCGELTDYMVRQFGGLHPVLLSLGSSRKLWEDTRQVPRDVVLFGNLPSKQFYADSLITRAGVEALSEEITAKMREIGHPFILGTECDVLSVPGCEQVIWEKVEVLMNPASAAEPVLLAR